jgi:hypothetical protein
MGPDRRRSSRLCSILYLPVLPLGPAATCVVASRAGIVPEVVAQLPLLRPEAQIPADGFKTCRSLSPAPLLGDAALAVYEEE